MITYDSLALLEILHPQGNQRQDLSPGDSLADCVRLLYPFYLCTKYTGRGGVPSQTSYSTKLRYTALCTYYTIRSWVCGPDQHESAAHARAQAAGGGAVETFAFERPWILGISWRYQCRRFSVRRTPSDFDRTRIRVLRHVCMHAYA